MEKIYTDKAPAAVGPYSQAVVINGMVYTSGQIALNPATGELVGETIEEQTEQVMKNLMAILEAAGTKPENVVKTLCFLTDIKSFLNLIEGVRFVQVFGNLKLSLKRIVVESFVKKN